MTFRAKTTAAREREGATTVEDVFDSEHVRKLRQQHVVVEGERKPYRYFELESDIALGLSADGFNPFKTRGKASCWPLMLLIFNLSPQIRYQLKHNRPLGIISGHPWDFDSFLYPMYEELVQLVHGVQAYERARDFIVALRAYLILIFGDMPAVAGIMRIKGPAAVHPCRVCSIPGIRDTSNGKNTSYYTPLHRANNIYEFEDLPIRTHEQFVKQSKWVADGRKKSNAECTRRSRSCGINGTPLLIRLLSLSVPALDFMHILENILPLLVDL